MENKFIEVTTMSDDKILVNTMYIKKIQPWSDKNTMIELISDNLIIQEEYNVIKKRVLPD